MVKAWSDANIPPAYRQVFHKLVKDAATLLTMNAAWLKSKGITRKMAKRIMAPVFALRGADPEENLLDLTAAQPKQPRQPPAPGGRPPVQSPPRTGKFEHKIVAPPPANVPPPSVSRKWWYVGPKKQRFGPISLTKLQKLYNAGDVHVNTYVLDKQKYKSWTLIKKIQDLYNFLEGRPQQPQGEQNGNGHGTHTPYRVVVPRGADFRRSPSMADKVLGKGVELGQIVNVVQVKGDWAHLDNGYWLPTRYNGMPIITPNTVAERV